MVTTGLLKTPLRDDFSRLFRQASQTMTVVSPYINRYGLGVLLEAIGSRPERCHISILTSISVNNIRSGSLDVQALAEFCQSYSQCTTHNLPGLHAKAYIADSSRAIITSANLTYGGLVRNHEYGVLISDKDVVGQIDLHMREYSSLGGRVSLEDLISLAEQAKVLRTADNEAEKSLRATQAWRILSKQIDALGDNLLRQRVRGKSVNAIFSETIRFVLKHGPLPTEELHAQVQAIHPDMCDDRIDRVIDGQHFGKKWKHMVRNSQQFLKRREQIRYDSREGVWRLVD